MNFRNNERGFTLVELMVAVAVLAIVGSAIFYSNNRAIQQQIVLEEKTVAGWIAQNQIAYLRLDQRVNSSQQNRIRDQNNRIQLGSREYEVVVSVRPSDSVAMIQHINVRVYGRPIDEDQSPLYELESMLPL